MPCLLHCRTDGINVDQVYLGTATVSPITALRWHWCIIFLVSEGNSSNSGWHFLE